MPNFLFVYRSEEFDEKDFSPEQLQQYMQLWMDWIGEGFAKGWMVDAGDALQPEGKVVNAQKVVTDGPFVESKEVVGGYTVVKADTLDQAAEIAKTSPIFETGGNVEVRQLAGLSGPKEEG